MRYQDHPADPKDYLPPEDRFEERQCTLRRAHPPHNWWGRKDKKYYHCGGRR